MKRKFIEIEQIKSAVIVVLFMMTILLLSFFWKDVTISDVLLPIDMIIEKTDEVIKPLPASLVRPADMTISFGTEVHTKVAPEYILKGDITEPDGQADEDAPANNPAGDSVVQTELYDVFVEAVSTYFNQGNTLIDEITTEQYGQIMAYPSIAAEYNYNIPFGEFLINNISEESIDSQQIEYITKIGYSSGSQESIFLYDGVNNKYYHLVVDKRESTIQAAANRLDKAIEEIENSGSTSFYKANTYFGGINQALLPYAIQAVMPKAGYNMSFTTSDEKAVAKTAKEFFGSSLDFVRKITENKGTLLYMYGYSEKVLLIDADGKIEYTEELNANAYSRENFYSSLSYAVDFVTTHGGWEDIIGKKNKPVLIDAEAINDSKGNFQGYRFVIGMKYENYDIYYADGEENLLTVEIMGTQVTKYMRDAIRIGENEINGVSLEMQTESPINIITSNYELISDILNVTPSGIALTPGSGGIENFDSMVAEIKYMGPCYLRPPVKQPGKDEAVNMPVDKYIVPSWVIRIKDTDFYFDIEDGALLSYVKKAVV